MKSYPHFPHITQYFVDKHMFHALYSVLFLTCHYFYSSLLLERSYFIQKGGENIWQEELRFALQPDLQAMARASMFAHPLATDTEPVLLLKRFG